MSSLNFEVSTYLKSRFVYVLVTDMMCCAPVVAERYNGSIRADIWVFIYFVSVRSFKCTFEPARSKFYKSFNAIFGRVALESVIIPLISSKCLLVLLYATEACPFLARGQSSVSFCCDSRLNENFSH